MPRRHMSFWPRCTCWLAAFSCSCLCSNALSSAMRSSIRAISTSNFKIFSLIISRYSSSVSFRSGLSRDQNPGPSAFGFVFEASEWFTIICPPAPRTPHIAIAGSIFEGPPIDCVSVACQWESFRVYIRSSPATAPVVVPAMALIIVLSDDLILSWFPHVLIAKVLETNGFC